MDALTQQTCTDSEHTTFAIRLSGVSKSFANAGEPLEVLREVDLTVREQAIVGLLGASGSGKSTLLNIISGILKPDRGQVCICGAASEEFNDWCAISYMFQDDRLLPWRTAIRNVEFALEAGSMPKAERARRARKALQSMDLGSFEGAFPYQLSGGMRRAEAALLADQVAVMSPRPGTIREVVDIALARPRDVTQPEVTRYMQRLRALI